MLTLHACGLWCLEVMEHELVRVFDKIKESPAVAQHGQVMTKPHIVDLILDLCDYRPGPGLLQKRLLEPGCGNGEFLVAAAIRLLHSVKPTTKGHDLIPCLLGVEKDGLLAEETRRRLAKVARDAGFSVQVAKQLADAWVLSGDFLRMDLPPEFDIIVGNPPYVRQEAIHKLDLALCRGAFSTFFDRADLYVAFIQKSLTHLASEGVLGFICPNRFTRNRYGTKLRALITGKYRLVHAIDLSQASPFKPEVLAYPGIYIIGQGRTNAVDFFHMTNASASECDEVRTALKQGMPPEQNGVRFHRYGEWFSGEEPWVTDSPRHLDLVRRLESHYPTLGSSASGTRVGIGVATGADNVFIVPPGFDKVEAELLLPLAMTSDCVGSVLRWGGNCVINPFSPEQPSNLIDFDAYPRARAYFLKHEARLRGRNVGKRHPTNWYRTIDRIYPSLLTRPKLLIPDIKADNVIAYDKGTCYPHHNLYYVVSDYWDLRALRAILRSSLAKFFVWVYGVRMRSDFLRFQAQYLRRIPVPFLSAMRGGDINRLVELDGEPDIDRIDAEVARVYGLTDDELALVKQAVCGPLVLDEAP